MALHVRGSADGPIYARIDDGEWEELPLKPAVRQHIKELAQFNERSFAAEMLACLEMGAAFLKHQPELVAEWERQQATP